MIAAGRKASFATMRRLFPFLKPYRRWVAVKVLSTTLNAANDIFLVYILNLLVNSSLSSDTEELKRSIYYMLLSVIVGIVLNFLDTYSSGRFSAYAARDLKDALSVRIDRLPISYLESRHSGELGSRITSGVNAIEHFLNGDLGAILFNVFRLSVSVIVMLAINWQLFAICMIMLPVMAVLTSTLSRPLNELSANYQQSLARTNAAVQDTVNGIHIIKAYNLHRVFFRKFKALLDRMLADVLLIEKRKALMGSVSIFIRTAPFLVYFIIGGYFVIEGRFTAGGLVAFAMLLNYLVGSIGVLPNLIGNYKITAGVAEHLFGMMDEETERKSGKRPDISQTAAAIEFRHVGFSYDGVTPVLDDVSFTLPRDKTIALVGSSGSGKTTAFNLITGFYDVQRGRIDLFGVPLSEWDLSDARTKISLVSQEAFLFAGTLEDNITCGNRHIGREKVEQAARLANIHDYIAALPDGYDTLVGERGVKLSGGQRQRISIARAILKNAPILLLDEATSALDTESEKLVQDAITRVMKGKTVLVVAHRLSTIVQADEILVLDGGRIIERGTHNELIAADGAYRRLFDQQLTGEGRAALYRNGKGA